MNGPDHHGPKTSVLASTVAVHDLTDLINPGVRIALLGVFEAIELAIAVRVFISYRSSTAPRIVDIEGILAHALGTVPHGKARLHRATRRIDQIAAIGRSGGEVRGIAYRRKSSAAIALKTGFTSSPSNVRQGTRSGGVDGRRRTAIATARPDGPSASAITIRIPATSTVGQAFDQIVVLIEKIDVFSSIHQDPPIRAGIGATARKARVRIVDTTAVMPIQVEAEAGPIAVRYSSSGTIGPIASDGKDFSGAQDRAGRDLHAFPTKASRKHAKLHATDIDAVVAPIEKLQILARMIRVSIIRTFWGELKLVDGNALLAIGLCLKRIDADKREEEC